jgi:hypothetical protein
LRATELDDSSDMVGAYRRSIGMIANMSHVLHNLSNQTRL